MRSVGVAIITYKAKKHLVNCLQPLLASSLKPKILVVNSSSCDGTVEMAKEMGVDVLLIPRDEFNHGLTRELARKKLGREIVVMMTPDAYATSSDMLEKLIHPLIENKASVSYARQIPHAGANVIEAFHRNYNYPNASHIRSKEDKFFFGVYTIFCSNSCAAYLNKALDEVGGFPKVLLGEDTLAVAKLLENGHKIAYVAEAQVQHSHALSFREEFKRHFDTGLVREEFREWVVKYGRDENRGRKYAKTLLKELFFSKPYLLPYGFLRLAVSWLGYKVGKMSLNAPLWWKKRLSSQNFYWK